jgi:site-specific DNA recombinase
VREELLGGVVKRIQIPADLADWIAEGLRESEGDVERTRHESLARATDRRRRAQAKLDRGYDDYLEGRISKEFWARKSQEWEAEASAAAGELSRLSAASPTFVATGERILELAKTAYFRYLEQPLAEKHRLLDTVLSNCTFDRGSLYPTYSQPFDVLAETVETGDWRGGRDSNPRPPA